MKKLLLLSVLLLGAQSLFAGRPIATWDVVPYQRVGEPFKIGVVAFHDKDVKVVFSVNGRKKWIAKRASLNARTGVTEFVFPFDPAKYEDGPVTIGASVQSAGQSNYNLPELPLYVDKEKELASSATIWVDAENGNDYNEGAEDAPVKTIKRAVQLSGDGGTVYLMAGSYTIKQIGGGLDRKYWTTITPAPDVARTDVKVLGGRLGTDKVKLVNLNIHTDATGEESRAAAIGEGGQTVVWFENCEFSNAAGRASGVSRPIASSIRAFITGGTTHDMTYGPHAELVRNHTVRDIAVSAFGGGNTFVANCTVSGIAPEDPTYVDSALYYGFGSGQNWIEDVILYNVKATDCAGSAFLTRQFRNAAFVNVSFEPASGCEALSIFREGLENVLFARIDLGAQGWWWYKALKKVGDVKPLDVRLYGVKVAEFRDAMTSMEIQISEDCDATRFPKESK